MEEVPEVDLDAEYHPLIGNLDSVSVLAHSENDVGHPQVSGPKGHFQHVEGLVEYLSDSPVDCVLFRIEVLPQKLVEINGFELSEEGLDVFLDMGELLDHWANQDLSKSFAERLD